MLPRVTGRCPSGVQWHDSEIRLASTAMLATTSTRSSDIALLLDQVPMEARNLNGSGWIRQLCD
jgi:hypothetical protein